MPTYDYKCKNCQEVIQAVQSITETPLTTCTKCNGTIFRVIGRNVGISFKGSGFYTNDSNSTSSSKTKESK
jgi:putative FmdB family regulatory protein